MDDSLLLRQYVEGKSEEAFAALVSHHINLVYSVALRCVGDPHQAEEVAQAVFILLAKKAAHLRHDKALSSWLFQTTRLTAGNFVRSESRRHRRELEAHMQSVLNDPGNDIWPRIAPLLDDAVAGLNEQDRHAIVLRFYEGRNLRDVGAALGASEDAAGKRVNRAVEKLRMFFAKRGVSVGAGGLVAVLSANAVQAAPSSLAKGLAAVALAKAAAVGGSTLTGIAGVLNVMAWTKTKIAIAAGVGILLVSGTATIIVKEVLERRTYPWQDMVDGGAMALKALDTTPPQVTIVPSKFKKGQPYRRLWADIGPIDQWRYIGTHAAPIDLVRAAYEGDQPEPPLIASEIVLASEMPGGFYDYIANLPSGSRDALAAEVRRRFGLVGKRETREMDVLLLQVDHPDAPGLTPGTPQSRGQIRQGSPVVQGRAYYQNQPISKLAARLESELQIPVVDQTGLAGTYDMVLPKTIGAWTGERAAEVNQVLRDELGLKLVSNRQPHQVLVIERAK